MDRGPARPLRVALVVPSLMVGGAEHHVVKLARAVDRALVDPVILLLRRGLPRELAPLVPPDVPVVTSPVSRRDPRIVPWLARELRARRIDVAQSFLWYAGAPVERVSVIANGVDVAGIDATEAAPLRATLGWPATAHVVGSVSRHVEGKGLDTLVGAIGRINGPDVRAVLIGDGPIRSTLESLALALGLGDRIAFLGQRAPATALLKGCDTAVQLSRESEHCSNTILEAMACGLPVVATAVGGNPELVAHERTGLLVPPGDADAVAVALTRLAADPEAAAEMGAAARETAASRYSMVSVAEEFTTLWRTAARR